MGIKAVKSHMHSTSHKAAVSCREQQLSIASFCATSSPATPLPSNTTAELAHVTAPMATSVLSSADIRVATGSTEVIWCLNNVVKYHSLNSNKGISDVSSQCVQIHRKIQASTVTIHI